MLDSLAFFFQVLIYVGIGLPIVNILMGALGSSGGSEADVDLDLDVDLDAGGDLGELDIDLGEVDADLGDMVPGAKTGAAGWKSPIQFNLYCLCLAMVIWGAIGTYAFNTAESHAKLLFMIIASFFAAVVAYCFLYRVLVKSLKDNDASALNINRLLHQHALVSFRILTDSPGQIQARDSVGATISYRAELDKDVCTVKRIDEGEEVIITEVDPKNSLCYVAPTERKILTRPQSGN